MALTSPALSSSDELRSLAHGIDGAEGPLVTRDGGILMVEPSSGRVLEVLAEGRTRGVADTGGIPAGLQLHADGSVWIADMKRGVLRLDAEGVVHDEVVAFEGAAIRGCNDLAYDSEGNLYFTAPAGSSTEHPVGEIFCRLADGTVRRLDGGFAFCNGIAVSADDRCLIVAETWTKTLWAYDLASPGVVSGKRRWGTLPGDHVGGPDGIDFDSEGHLLAANWGGAAIEIFAPDGNHVARISLPFAKPSNLHFRGPDSRELLVTEHDSGGLWSVEHFCAGQCQFGWGPKNL